MEKERVLLRIPPASREAHLRSIRFREAEVVVRDILFAGVLAITIFMILTSEGTVRLTAIFIIFIVFTTFLMMEVLDSATISILITITTKGVYLHRLRYLVWMRNEFYPKESIEKLVYSVRYHWVKLHLKSGKVIIARPYFGDSIYYKPPESDWRGLIKEMRQAAETINVKFEVEPGKKSWEREISERNA